MPCKGDPTNWPWHLGKLDTEILFLYFRGCKSQDDLTIYLVTLVRNVIGKVFGSATKLTSDGVYMYSEDNIDGRARAALQAQLMYYRVLLHILQTLHPCVEAVGVRHKRKNLANPQETYRLLSIPDFHLGLLTCSLELVSQVVLQDHEPLQTLSLVDGSCNMLAVWDATRWYMDCFTRQQDCSLTAGPLNLLLHIRQRAQEQLVLASGSNFYEVAFTGGGGMYATGDISLVTAFVSALAAMAVRQVNQLSAAVAAAHGGATQGLAGSCVQLMEALVMQRLDLFFGQHASILVACCVYGVAKVLQLSLSFKAIITQAVATLPNVTPATFHACSLPAHQQAAANEGLAGQVVDIRMFYNMVFLPACDAMVLEVHRAHVAMQVAQAAQLEPAQDVAPPAVSGSAKAAPQDPADSSSSTVSGVTQPLAGLRPRLSQLQPRAAQRSAETAGSQLLRRPSSRHHGVVFVRGRLWPIAATLGGDADHMEGRATGCGVLHPPAAVMGPEDGEAEGLAAAGGAAATTSAQPTAAGSDFVQDSTEAENTTGQKAMGMKLGDGGADAGDGVRAGASAPAGTAILGSALAVKGRAVQQADLAASMVASKHQGQQQQQQQQQLLGPRRSPRSSRVLQPMSVNVPVTRSSVCRQKTSSL